MLQRNPTGFSAGEFHEGTASNGWGVLSKLPEEAVFSFPTALVPLLETQLRIRTPVYQLCRAVTSRCPHRDRALNLPPP